MREAHHGLGPRQLGGQRRGLFRRCHGKLKSAKRQLQLGQARPGQGVPGIDLHGPLRAGQGAIEVEGGLLGVGARDPGRGCSRRLLGGQFRRGQGPFIVTLGHRHDSRQGVGIAAAGLDLQHPVDVGARLVDPSHREQQRSAIGQQPEITGRLRHLREGSKGPGQIAFEIGGHRGAHRRFRPGGRPTLGAQVDHRRIVQRPMHRIARPHQQIAAGSATGTGDGALAGAQSLGSQVVLRNHRAFENLDLGLVARQAHEEFRAFDGAVHIGRADGDAPRLAAQRGKCPARQGQQGFFFRFFGDIDQPHRGVLIQAEHRLVDQRDFRTAEFSGTDGIALAELVAQFCGQPLRGGKMLDFHGPLRRDHLPDVDALRRDRNRYGHEDCREHPRPVPVRLYPILALHWSIIPHPHRRGSTQ